MQALLYMYSLILLMEMRGDGDGDPESSGTLNFSHVDLERDGCLVIAHDDVTGFSVHLLLLGTNEVHPCSQLERRGTELMPWWLELSNR